MGNMMTVNATLFCPHGGAVQIITTNVRAKVGGALAALSTDQFLITGCPFVVGIVPSPCLTVQWVVTDLRSTISGAPTLGRNSVGLCMNAAQAPQGPVIIANI